ncbi:hypothetical protein [Acinetobacter sp. YH12136]|uniref:hypothetical protein n=1 Tax=Acinetobacter sp. YH12136 TaxID=2601120 RepID=UPI0015D1E9A1|nr:hypothetical protein [Acinetobacter sp. YH12136]
MADQPVTREKLINADIDVDNLGKAVNELGVVNPRYGNSYKTIPQIAREYDKNSGTKGFNTLAEFEAVKATIPAHTVINIGEAGPNQGQNFWNGTTLTKSAYDPLAQAKAYTDTYARSQAYDNTRHLDTYDKEGRVSVRFNADATLAKGFPLEAVDRLAIIDIYRNGEDSTVVQKITIVDRLILVRRKFEGVWSDWEIPAITRGYDNTRHLDDYTRDGRFTLRFYSDATIAKGFPQEAIGQTGYLEVTRNGNDAAVYQQLSLASGLILTRNTASGVWSSWDTPKTNRFLPSSTNIKTLALSLQRSVILSMTSNGGTIANGYPYEGAQGTIEVFANDDWSAKTIRFTSVNRQTWICTYRDNTGTGTWSEWVRLDYNDGGIFGVLDKAKTTLFDFNDISSVDSTTLNAPIKIAYSASNLTQVQPYAGFSSPTAVLSTVGGGAALTSIASTALSCRYKTTANLLTGVNQTLAIAFYHDDNSAIHSIFSQTSAGQTGRLQIAANCYFNGSALTYEKDSLCVFLGGVTDGLGFNGSVKKGQLLKGWNTLILQIGDGSKASKFLANGKLVDTFTSTIYNGESVIFPELVSSTKSLVKIGRIVAHKDILSDNAIDQLHQWLVRPYKAPDKYLISPYELSRKPVKHTAISGITLASSLAVGCMIASDDGSYMSRDVLYAFNPDMQLQIYSTTKIMTFMVLMDMQPSLNEVLTRTEFDPAIGSGANLDVGDQIYLRDALYNLMLPSSNVSARMIARTFGHKLLIKDGVVGGTDTQAVARWVTQMNLKAAEIGMTDTLYATPDGNGADKSTVIDLLKKGNYALKYSFLNKVWNTKRYTLDVFGSNPRAIVVTNSNTLLENDYTIGGKTGSATLTNLVAVHQLPDLQKLVTVVLHSANTVDRNADTMSMVNVALARY